MKKKHLQSRLDALEKKIGVDASPSLIICMEFAAPNGQFGGSRCDAYRADGGGRVWHILPGESQEAFHARVTTEMPKNRLGPSFVIFFSKGGDGIPPAPIDAPRLYRDP
jgi:hypothetical protein